MNTFPLKQKHNNNPYNYEYRYAIISICRPTTARAWLVEVRGLQVKLGACPLCCPWLRSCLSMLQAPLQLLQATLALQQLQTLQLLLQEQQLQVGTTPRDPCLSSSSEHFMNCFAKSDHILIIAILYSKLNENTTKVRTDTQGKVSSENRDKKFIVIVSWLRQSMQLMQYSHFFVLVYVIIFVVSHSLMLVIIKAPKMV